MHPLETYLAEIAMLRGATKETSGYPALANLLNAVGHTLKPKVRCIIHPKNSGAGIPDGGLFTPDQLKQYDEGEIFGELIPARGVIEVKSVGEDIADFAESEQVEKYLAHYGQVLLTNYREFLLLKRIGGKTHQLEGFQLAPDEKSFWLAAAHPRKTADALGEHFLEYLKRVMLHNAPLNNPKDVAFFLASYARTARVSVEAKAGLPALAAVRGALEEALGMKFEAKKGEHFFRSTLVQTLFYGVFSAWVLWHKEKPQRKNDFDWKSAAWTLHVPMIKALFEQVATPTKLGPLGLVEILDWTAAALNRVVREEFFARFVEDHAVQYFYEPFLEEFDPELRKQLGVWYTPPEIVQYQVARVDAALRDKDGLNIPDGLADPRVFVLDPCCGTGAYLVEVLRVIAQTLKEEKGEGALAELEVKEAAQKRIFGFEIMPAPFVVAHLQMGLLLQNLGVPLDDAKGERAGIFLTNALTGWDFAGENPKLATWPELEAERKGAGKVKQEKPILVILGNPPYNAYAGISPQEEQGLVEVYKGAYEEEDVRSKKKSSKQGSVMKKIRRYRLSDPVSKGGWGIKKFNLDDLYVRFFRIAERKIAEHILPNEPLQGIVSFISNHSWISDPSFVVMREHLLKSFDRIWVENLHGNRKISEYAPDGQTSETIFALQGFSVGIQQGVATSLLVRTGKKRKPLVLFRDDLNAARAADRRAQMLASLKTKKFDAQYEKVDPNQDNRFSFRASDVASHYLAWPRLTELCAEAPSNGLMEKRSGALIDTDRMALERRMRDYYDPNVSWDELKALKTGLTEDAARFGAKGAREIILEAEEFQSDQLLRYALRPFDTRWCYYSSKRPLWNEPRPTLWEQCWKGNTFLLSRMNCSRSPEGAPMSFTPCLCDDHYLTPDAVAIPLRLRHVPKTKSRKKDDGNGEFGSIMHEAAPAYKAGEEKTSANLSPVVRAYLAKLGIENPDDADTSALIWMHALAIGYSPAYLAENADGIRQDWPRIPLPDSKAALLASAELGKQVASLLDTENGVEGVTAGKLKPEFKEIAVLSSTKNLSVTAGWGHAGKEGVTMPGKGKIATKILEAAPGYNLPWFEFHDVYLNESACWKDIPAPVWDYTIGGYQVIKKWLSYREFGLLGRALTPDEAREVTHMARRIAALILLQPELDKNYQAVKAATVSL